MLYEVITPRRWNKRRRILIRSCVKPSRKPSKRLCAKRVVPHDDGCLITPPSTIYTNNILGLHPARTRYSLDGHDRGRYFKTRSVARAGSASTATPPLCPRLQPVSDRGDQRSRITSYNVCYTKLLRCWSAIRWAPASRSAWPLPILTECLN